MTISLTAMLTNAVTILLLYGVKVSLQQDPGGPGGESSTVSSKDNTSKVDETYIEELTYDPYHSLIIWHGNCILFACLVLAPSGIFVARFLKETWSTKLFFGIPMWLMVHFTYMLATVMFLSLGMTFANAHNAATPHAKQTPTREFHCYGGWAAISAFLLQFAFGHLLPFSNDSIRPVFRMLHWALGTIVAYFSIFLAMVSASLEGSQFPYFAGVVILAWLIFTICMNITIAVSMHKQDTEALSDDLEGKLIYYRAFWPIPIPIINFDEEPKDSFFRTVLFVWYQFGCLVAFTIIFIPNTLGLGHYDCMNFKILNFDCDLPRTHTIY